MGDGGILEGESMGAIIWSLSSMLVALLFVAYYLSGDIVGENKNDTSIQAIDSLGETTQSSVSWFTNYLVKNKGSLLTVIYMVIIAIVAAIVFNTIKWKIRKKKFAYQNKISSEKVRKYQQRFSPKDQE